MRLHVILLVLIVPFSAFVYYLKHLDEQNGLNGSPICCVTFFLPTLLWPVFLFRDYLLPYRVEGAIVASVLYFIVPEGPYDAQFDGYGGIIKKLPEPNYALNSSWGAKGMFNFPTGASIVPDALSNKTKLANNNERLAKADCFYLHPTTVYVDSLKTYNIPYDHKGGKYIFLDGMLPTQASVFNSVARIYAPYYREMVGTGYFTKNNVSRNMAMDLAYADVKRAFEHYLRHFGGKRRPIILASHSQGTEHAMRLLRDYFNPETNAGKHLLKRLIAAYLPGMPIYKSVWQQHFPYIKVCDSPSSLHCVASWNTLAYNSYREMFQLEPATSFLRSSEASADDVPICTNPLTWKSRVDFKNDSECVSREYNKGSYYLLQFRQGISYLLGKRPTYDRITHLKPLPLGQNVVGACCINGYNRVHRPAMSWPYFVFNAWSAFSFPGGNFHSYDYAFYYQSIRNNVELRWEKYQLQSQQASKHGDEGVGN